MFIFFRINQGFPFRIEYETPETLGNRQDSCSSRGINLFPESEILVIDAGTAITYDYLSQEFIKVAIYLPD